MALNDAGRMVEHWWLELQQKFTTVGVDTYVMMPNHVHGVIIIRDKSNTSVGADLCVGPREPGAHTGAPLPTIIQWFKTLTTNAYLRGVKTSQWPPIKGHLWQRNYYEHIVRNERELGNIRDYILTNPLHWHLDRENPKHITQERTSTQL